MRLANLRSRLALSGTELSARSLWTIVALVVGTHVTAAWFNAGSPNVDEHYQILEFAQYKLGRQPPEALAWEFAERMRPALQPWLAALIIRLLQSVGAASPFVAAFALRLLSTFLAVWVTLEIGIRCLRPIERPWLKVLAFGVSFGLWFAPTVHGRFSSENWGGALFVGALCLMLDTADVWARDRRRAFVLAVCAGLLGSAAFYCRFQMAAAIAGAGLWFVVVRRAPVSLVAVMAAAFLAGCGLNEIVDRWLYGAWTLAPYRYVIVNLVQGKAATFGVSPWWTPLAYLAVVFIPPYSVGVVVLLAIGSWYARHHLVVWVTLPFLLLHAFIAHKELRFLIPLLYIVGPLLAVCLDSLPPALPGRLFAWLRAPWGRVHVALWGAANALLLCAAIFMPMDESSRIERWLWDNSRNQQVTVYTVGRPPYLLSGATTKSFYRSENVLLTAIEPGQFDAAHDRGAVFAYYRGLDVPAVIAAAGTCLPVVRAFPAWLMRLTFVTRVASIDQSTICRIDGPG